jgi:large subunit ribosomal protein L13
VAVSRDLAARLALRRPYSSELTGKSKSNNKNYYWHTGYPGGIKKRTAKEIFSSPHPEMILLKAIQRMIPRTNLGRKQMSNLKIYSGNNHPHKAQKPEILDIAKLNPKNKKRN